MSSATRLIVICLLGLLALFAARTKQASNRGHAAHMPAASATSSNSTSRKYSAKVVAAPPPVSVLPQLELDELLKPVPAKEPAEALKTFETLPGFHVELAAHEPDVVDPVAAAFDEKGRLFVTEMRDYPFRPKEGDKPTGRVRMLTDTDGDGRYDTSTTYADELLWLQPGVVLFQRRRSMPQRAQRLLLQGHRWRRRGRRAAHRLRGLWHAERARLGELPCLGPGWKDIRQHVEERRPDPHGRRRPIRSRRYQRPRLLLRPANRETRASHRWRPIRQRLRRLGESLSLRSGQSVNGSHAAESVSGS